jgi:hypothetical protein
MGEACAKVARHALVQGSSTGSVAGSDRCKTLLLHRPNTDKLSATRKGVTGPSGRRRHAVGGAQQRHWLLRAN